jgi:CMP-N-acetylneuraminic acid synthetase
MPGAQSIAFIPARGGSKGIKNKNLALLAGKPLIAYAIQAAQDSGVITRIIVSSDAPEILKAAEALGAEGLKRPAELATDSATTDAAIAHFVTALELATQPETTIVLLQPTSPLRTGAHIAQAFALWQTRRPRGVISVYEPAEHPAKAFQLGDDGLLTGLYGADAPFAPRQSLTKAFMPNGAIYIFSVAEFLANSCVPRAGLAPFIMDVEDSLDIDSPSDLEAAERILQGKPR